MRAQEKKTPEMQFIMDEKGNLVYYNPNSSVTDFKILPDGRISCYENGKIFLFDKSMHRIDSLSCVNGAETDPHDFTVLPNGHFLMIGARTAEEDLSKLFLFTKEKIAGSKKAKVKYGVIQEFDAQKNLVYEWNSRPWFAIENMDPFALKDSAKVDLTHFNSIEPLADGNFLVSARYSNEIVKVTREDGSIAWRLGGRLNQFHFSGDTVPFIGQHDARILPNGHLTLFDNGYDDRSNKHNARALEYAIDEKAKTATLVWSYTWPGELVSESTGNTQRLANGNTLVNFGQILDFTSCTMFTVVDPNGKSVFDLTFADTLGTYRAFFYPGEPLQLPRPQVSCKWEDEGFQLSVDCNNSCCWSTGENSNSILVTKPGTYYVLVPFLSGGYIGSVPVTITAEMIRRKSLE